MGSANRRGESSPRGAAVERDLFGFTAAAPRRRVRVEVVPWRFRIAAEGRTASAPLADGAALERTVLRCLAPREADRRALATLAFRVEIAVERARLLAGLPDEVRAVHERVFAVTGVAPAIVGEPALFERRWLVSDLIRLPAAAAAAAALPRLLGGDARLGLAERLDRLDRWPDLFAPDGRAYTSLRRTLGALAPPVCPWTLAGLRFVRLVRPIRDPLELRLACTAGLVRGEDGGLSDAVLDAVLRADAREIRSALARADEADDERLGGSSAPHLGLFLQLLDGAGEAAGRRLGGLVRRAIERRREREIERVLEASGLPETLRRPETPTVPPPFWYPDGPGVEFLATLGRVVDEGRRMRHCVGTLAARAVRGTSYFFHVEHEGRQATVELDRRARIREVAGPCDAENEATRWAEAAFARAGRGPRWRRALRAVEALEAEPDAEATFAELRRRHPFAPWLAAAERMHRAGALLERERKPTA